MTKKRTGLLQHGAKRDDISSQMLENETVADPQNSLRNLNFVGSSFYADASKTSGDKREHKSQTAIRKKISTNDTRGQLLAQSLEELTKPRDGEGGELDKAAGKRVVNNIVSQSIDMANQFTHKTEITSGEAKLGGGFSNMSPEKIRESALSSSKKRSKKPLSNMTSRAGVGNHRSTNVNEPSSPSRRQGRTSNINSKNDARHSPLICLSQQEFEKKANAGTDIYNNSTQEPASAGALTKNFALSSKSRPLPHNALMMRPKTN